MDMYWLLFCRVAGGNSFAKQLSLLPVNKEGNIEAALSSELIEVHFLL